MATITDYQSLVDAVVAYFVRAGDAAFIAQVPTFIQLAEAGFDRKLRSRYMENTVTRITDADGYATLPDDWLEPRAIYLGISGNTYLTDGEGNYLLDDDGNYLTDGDALETSYRRPLTVLGAGAVANLFPYDNGGYSDYVVITGNQIRLLTNSSSEVMLTYAQRFVGLSASNTTNWILTHHPDLYLFSTMTQAAVWLEDWTKASTLGTQARSIADEINDQMSLESYATAGMVLGADGNIP